MIALAGWVWFALGFVTPVLLIIIGLVVFFCVPLRWFRPSRRNP
jgi:hypothetical protein